jgi:ferredoxin
MPVAASPTAARLRVNPIRCTAFGFCAEYAPELFALDEWGYAWPHGREIPADLETLAREAAALCPTRAILVEALRPTANPPKDPIRKERT